MAHPNEELIRKGYAAFTRGDMETLRNEVFDSGVTLHVAGRSPISGDYDGIDAVFGFFGQLMDRTGGSFRVELHDALANEEHAVGISTVSGQRDGKSIDGERAPRSITSTTAG